MRLPMMRSATSYPSLRSCRGDPIAHRLIAGTIDVHCVIDLGHPSEGDEVVLPFVVFCKLDAIRTLHVVDDGKLSAVRANDGAMRLDFAGLDHINPRARFMPPSSPPAYPENTAADASVFGEGLAIASGEAHACRQTQEMPASHRSSRAAATSPMTR
jgi:hypothetical protein